MSSLENTVANTPREIVIAEARKSIVVIAHGYDGDKPGYTAHAGLIDIPGGSTHTMTAAHNVDEETNTAIILNPSTGDKHIEPFGKYTPDDAPDTAISKHPRKKLSEDELALPAGERPRPGDELIVVWKRHTGNGVFTEASIEGVSVAPVVDERDGNLYQAFHVSSDEGNLGDSGVHVIPLTREGTPQTHAETVGSFRGFLREPNGHIAIFSPVPQEVIEITRNAKRSLSEK